MGPGFILGLQARKAVATSTLLTWVSPMRSLQLPYMWRQCLRHRGQLFRVQALRSLEPTMAGSEKVRGFGACGL